MPTLVLQPSAAAGIDTDITDNAPTFNWGIRADFHAGMGASSATWIAMVKFDVSSIPAGSTISSATLALYCTAEDSSTDIIIGVYRSLVVWFEGVKNGAAPDASQDGSTWNLRNANGSLTWPSSLGNESGSNWAASTNTQTVNTTGVFFNWTVTADVQGFVSGTFTNLGWFIKKPNPQTINSRKFFASSDDTTAANRPKLTVVYYSALRGTSAGTSTVTASIEADGTLRSSVICVSSVSGYLHSNAIFGQTSGSSTVSGSLLAQVRLMTTAAGVATVIGRISGDGRLAGSASGVGTGTGLGSVEGQLRGAATGSSTAVAVGLAAAKHVARVQGCYGEPLLYLTDGSIKSNGQLNRLSLIDTRSGYLLKNWRPAISQYKEGGTFSESAQATGRKLTKRVFANAIEVMELTAKGPNEDALIDYIKELLGWQEAAADYGVTDWAETPIYLVDKPKNVTNPRYALIHVMSVAELDNPYAQPFVGGRWSALEQLTLRIERGDWTSNPPGQYECVPVSSVRSWTVAAWQTGS